MEPVKVLLTADHFVWAMFTTPDGRYVIGREQITARSPGLDMDAAINRRRRYEKVNLSADSFPDGRAYAFLPLDGGVFVFCHYQLSGLEEPPPSRGQHIFAHYIWTTAEQLNHLSWNLLPVFDLFTDIPLTSHLATLEPFALPRLVSQPDERGLNRIAQQSDLSQAVIARLLNQTTTENPIILTPGNSTPQERLAWLCGVALCLPAEIRQTLYFSTAADASGTKAGLFFAVRDDRRAIDWDAPAATPPNGPGRRYAGWAVALARKKPTTFFAEMDSLRDCRLAGAAASLAVRYDLSADFINWKDAHRAPSDTADLDRLGKEINTFWPCLSDVERINEFHVLLLNSIQLDHQPAIEALLQGHYPFLDALGNKELVAGQLSNHLAQGKSNVAATARFLMMWGAGRNVLARFQSELLEAVLRQLPAQAPDSGMAFWRALVESGWQPQRDTTVPHILESMPGLSAAILREVIAIIARFVDSKSLASLEVLLKKNMVGVGRDFPSTIALVEALGRAPAAGRTPGLTLVVGSYGETDNRTWLAATTRMLLGKYPVASFSSRPFLEVLSRVVAEAPADAATRQLLDTLGDHPRALNATGEQDLRSLLKLAVKADSPLALDCLLGLLLKERLDQPIGPATFDLALKVNRRALTQRLATNADAVAAGNFPDLEQWLAFLGKLADGNDAPPEERRTLQACYASAFAAVQAGEQLRDAQALGGILDSAINPPLAEGHERLLWQLTNQVLYSYNLRALASIRDAFAQSDPLRQYYRERVSEICHKLIADTRNGRQWLDFSVRLAQEGCVWESTVIYIYLLLDVTNSDVVVNQYPNQLSAILQSIPADISLEEFGHWVYQTRLWHHQLLDSLSREMSRSPEFAQQLQAKARHAIGDNQKRTWRSRLRENRPDNEREAREFLHRVASIPG